MRGKKNNQKFFKLSQRIFIAQRRFFFQNILQGLKFFWAHFWCVQALVTLIFHAFFCLSTPKKRPKKALDDLKIKKLTMLRYAPNLDIIDIDVIYSVPFHPKAIFEPTTQNTIFGSFFDPKFFWGMFFGLKKPTFE